eukprot:gene17850-18079_t
MVEYYSLYWLKPSEWAQAYPLVRMVHPGWTLAQWHKRARQLSRAKTGPDGLLAVRDVRGIVHALLSCKTEQDFSGHKYIRISDLMLARLPGAQIDAAILDGIVRICAEHHCAALVLDIPDNGDDHLSLDKDVLSQYEFEPRGKIYSRLRLVNSA